MKRKSFRNKFEVGQVIPLVVLLLVVILSMVALILDGGSIMSNRRTAQAAADSGALAGAQRACSGQLDAKTVAEAYAINNGASTAEATVDGTEVTVVVTVENSSFFAKVFGVETLTGTAEAVAGCYGVSGKSVVPLAWYCKAPPVGGGPYPEEYGCQIQTISWDVLGTFINGGVDTVDIEDFDHNVVTYYRHTDGTSLVDSDGNPPEQIYIIMESDKICIEDGGEILCDLDGDGKKDVQVSGDRGWLYLTADTSNIGDWVDEGPHPDITLVSHIWLSGKSGVTTSVYTKMISSGYIGEVVLIPVFNYFCDGDPRTDSTCVEEAHASPPWPPFYGEDDFSQIRNKSDNYHIIAFEPFYVSCVSKKGDCPGFRLAQALSGGELKDGPVIEGYFLSDMDVSPDSDQGCDINLGNCTISLSK
jgi:hypothetical protein